MEVDRTSSVASQRSFVSRQSATASSAERARDTRAKLAALEQAKQFTKKEAELEKSRLENEHTMKLLNIEKEAAMARAELTVFEEIDDELNVECSNQVHKHCSEASQSVLCSSHSKAFSTQVWIEQLNETMKKSQLPKLELTVFEGDPLNFQQWIMSFEKLIEDSTSDPARRMHYLMQYTSGEANVVVSGCALDQSREGYSNAKGELRKEFGNPVVLARAYLKRIDDWSIIKPGDGAALRTFSMFLNKCRGSMPSLHHLQQLNTDFYLQRIVVKLPAYIQGLWRKRVNVNASEAREVDFNMLVSFIEQQSRIMNDPVFSADALRDVDNGKIQSRYPDRSNVNSGRSGSSQRTVLSTTATPSVPSNLNISSGSSVLPCPWCGSLHDLDECEAYRSRSLSERRSFLVERHLCFGCYNPCSENHNARTCQNRRSCSICKKSHPTGLHRFQQPPHVICDNKNSHRDSVNHRTDTVLTSATSATRELTTLMSITLVRLSSRSNPAREILVYAALDTLSSACFITEDVWRSLNIPGEKSEITIKTVVSEKKVTTVAVTGLQVSPYNGGPAIQLPRTFTQPHLPMGAGEIPTREMLQRWPHLAELTDVIPEYDESVPIGLLIGADCPRALQPHKVIASENDGPFAMQTSVGWCVSGPADETCKVL